MPLTFPPDLPHLPRPQRSKSPHDSRRRRRKPGQGQDHQQIPRPGLHGPGQLRTRARPAVQGWIGEARRGLRHGLGGRRQGPEAAERDRRGRQGRRQADPGHRPGPRGRGHLLARAGSAESQEGAEGRGRPAGGVQRHHQVGRHRGDEEPSRHRHGAGRRLPGPPGAGLSGGLHPVAGALAQAAGRPLGRAGAVRGAAPGGRPRDRDRSLPDAGILDCRSRRVGRRRALPGPAGQARGQEAPEVRLGRRSLGEGGSEGGRGRPVPRLGGGDQARPPHPRPALHHLDPAAGSGAQARLLGPAHHAGGPEAL